MECVCLSEKCHASLVEWANAGYPAECCGLLIGERKQEKAMIKQVIQARNLNVDRARDRYVLDPDSFLAADIEARKQGMEILGIWHTHPDHPAQPSETDRQNAWPEWSYLILEVSGGGVRDMRAWRLNAHQAFEEEEIRI